MTDVKVAKAVVPVREGAELTVCVFVGDECVAAFAKLDDADLFAVHKRNELKAREEYKARCGCADHDWPET